MTQCALPSWASGYHAAGISPNAYDRPQDVQSLALGSNASGLSGGQKAGIAVGSVVGFLLLAAGVGYAVVRNRRASPKKKPAVDEVEKGSIASKSTN